MYVPSSKVIKVFASGLKGLRTVQGLSSKSKDLIVIIGKDLNVQNDFSTEIEIFCTNENINFSYGKHKSNNKFGLAVAAGWQRMIYDVPSHALIVFHDSLLPKYRGFNPLVTALLNEDDTVGVTALTAAEKYDCGDIIAQIKIPIFYPILISTAIEKVAEAYFEISKEIYERFVKEHLIGQPQNNELATYSLWRDEFDYRIDWSLSAEKIQLLVNSVGYPYLGASTILNDDLIRIKKVTLIDDLMIENRTTGKIIFFDEKMPVVVCGKGLIRLDLMETNDGKLFIVEKMRTRFK
ncbi:methionyl-tRNA formyltransferase [Shewanella baltica]|uniref:methionyl-tRNA formyltransferase n=1 Tax=Shewanella baltica TaxID=62322 RepID=UPI003D7A1FFB